MAINATDRDLRKIVLDGFAGGVDEFETPEHVQPHSLVAVKNMDMRNGRLIASRRGQAFYLDRSYRALSAGCEAMLRYRSSTGVKKIVIVSGGTMYADNDDGKFDPVGVSFTGTPILLQYRDVVLYGSSEYEFSVYDPIAGTITRPDNIDGLLVAMTDLFTVASSTGTDGNLENGWYEYRYTFSIEIGGVYLGETGQLFIHGSLDNPSVRAYRRDFKDVTGGTDKNKITFSKLPAGYYNIPSWASEINIYRSPALAATPTIHSSVEEDLDMYWIGAISIDDLNAAADGVALFVDDGLVIQDQMRKAPVATPYKPVLSVFHMNKLWVETTTGLYFSELDEPFLFYPESFVNPKPFASDTSTGLLSYRDEVLFSFYFDSMYAVLGSGVEDIRTVLVDPYVGCVAAETLKAVEGGFAWQSNRGPYFYGGTHPIPLAGERVQRTMDSIPAHRRPRMCAVYDSKAWEYNLFYTLPGDGVAGLYNRRRSRYNFRTRKWTHDVLEAGVSRAIEVRDEDSPGYVLWGHSDNPGTMLISGRLIVKADTGFVEGVAPIVSGGVSTNEKIDFSFQTAYLDDSRPFEDKKWLAVMVKSNSQVPLTLDVLIDNKYDSRTTAASLTIAPPTVAGQLIWNVGQWAVGKWGTANRPGSSRKAVTRFHDTVPVGKSCSFIISGLNSYDPVEIYSITVFYKSEGVRQDESA